MVGLNGIFGFSNAFKILFRKMKLIKLTPVDNEHSNWKCSSYKGDLIVRAHDVQEARKIAASEFPVQGGLEILSPSCHNHDFFRAKASYSDWSDAD
ncbi:MAG: hypothetical protein F6K19_45430 [Cyanothece sp. SIO1E1]|nr:hypothetical protein [Cyanothece sp. SIO1E1]